MYAVIETGGKQYRVQPGDILDVELLAASDAQDADAQDADAQERRTVTFDRVLMVGGDDGVQIGKPVLEGAQVQAEALGQIRGPKVTVFKMKRRKGYRRKNGHRQDLLRVRIQEIQV